MQRYIVCARYENMETTEMTRTDKSRPYNTKDEAVGAALWLVQDLAGKFPNKGPGDGAGARWVRQNLEMYVSVVLQKENTTVRVWIQED